MAHVTTYESVEFSSEGATLRGRLYLRPGRGARGCVVMAHGTSATIGMVADRFAEAFHDAGLAVLLYDHRGFGASGGEPRQEINPWIQARGYRDAVTFASGHPAIDPERIALWGDSYSAGQVLVVGAIDPRPAALVLQVPSCGRVPPPPDPDGALFAAMRATFDGGDVRGTPETTEGPLPVVSPDQLGSPSLLAPITAYRWFMEYGGRHGTGWENRVTRAVPPTPVPYHVGLATPHLQTPLLALIARDDEMIGSKPAIAHAVIGAAPAETEVVQMDGGHFGLLWHPGPLFDQAVGAQRDFLLRRLT
jgi:pimeloyl-ACP methyl ester carboxylesterase